MAPVVSSQARLKISLKMAVSKLRFVQTKQTALAKQQRRQMADLLSQGKETSAKIRVENIIRDDIYVELLEYLELYCELLLARIGLLEQRECDPGLVEAVKTIIYTASRAEIKELVTIKEILMHKFGPEFSKSALENEDNAIPQKIVTRCSVIPPSEKLVDLYLSEIAKAYQVSYSGLVKEEEIESSDSDEDPDNGGTAIEVLEAPIKAKANKSTEDGATENDDKDKSPISIKPPHKTTDNPKPQVKIPESTSIRKKKLDGSYKQEDDEFAALRKRFEALKKS